MYKVMGEYEGVQSELDSSSSLTIALYLVEDYIKMFGERWAIWVKEQ